MRDPVSGCARLAAVIIGRNEGAKLDRSLRSVPAGTSPVVYVDSCSRDGSVELARRAGASIVELTIPPPCSVARARNAGFARAVALVPDVELVQFLDADSELASGWCEAACAAMRENPNAGAVYGALRERYPQRSLLSRIYHVDLGRRRDSADACPGISVVRAAAFRAVGGFSEDLLGFEDRELSTRLRCAGWQVRQLDAPMAVHEVGRQSFAAWWNRRLHGGSALAHELALHPDVSSAARRASYSAWLWGLVVPLGAVAAATMSHRAVLVWPLAYAALFARITRRVAADGFSRRDAACYAAATVLAKLPEAIGQLRFHWQRWVRR